MYDMYDLAKSLQKGCVAHPSVHYEFMAKKWWCRSTTTATKESEERDKHAKKKEKTGSTIPPRMREQGREREKRRATQAANEI